MTLIVIPKGLTYKIGTKLKIFIAGINRTGIIQFGSVSKEDNLNQKIDTFKFSIKKHTGQSFKPVVNQEVEIFQDAEKIFAGLITDVSESLHADNILIYDAVCSDWKVELNRRRPAERYNDMTVDDIIDDLITTYAPDFTIANVDCDIMVKSITFNRIPLADCLEKLARMTNFSWYVDYDKDLHFFEKNTEESPFDITDTNGFHIPDTLDLSDDISQVRNRVYVKGGEAEGEVRTELESGTGAKLTFPLANKFAQLPTVEVGGLPVLVGIDFLSNEDDFDAFWDFNQKYIRFKASEVPASGTDNIEITGIPLFAIQAQVEEPDSISLYGVYEYAIIDRSIESKQEAKARGLAEIGAFAAKIIEGSFDTYNAGLRSGQIININSAIRGLNQDFLIQRVRMKQISPNKIIWTVTLATLRTLGIIDFLIDQLRSSSRLIEESENEILDKYYSKKEVVIFNETVTVSKVQNLQSEEVIFVETVTVRALDYAVEFVVGDHFVPAGFKRQFIANGSRIT